MTPQDLIAAFETLADAPDGTKRLRELVLQLAVRGKLVAQDASDEPASVLLTRIAAEKARLVAEKKIRKPKVLPPIEADEVPFAVPQGWEWARVGTLLAEPLSNGRSVPTQEGGFPVLRLSAIRGDTVNLADSKPGAWTREAATPWLVRGGDFLIARGNGAIRLVGRGALVAEDGIQDVAFPDTAIRIRVDPRLVGTRFTFRVWNSPMFGAQIEDKARTTSGIYKISQRDVLGFAFPLPPLAEQHRIVAKVDALMALCDDLEARLTAAKNTRAAFAAAAVHHLDAA